MTDFDWLKYNKPTLAIHRNPWFDHDPKCDHVWVWDMIVFINMSIGFDIMCDDCGTYFILPENWELASVYAD